MTNQEILIKVTDKARANGYEFWDNKMCPNCDRYIFTHEFAKAFWGKEYTTVKVASLKGVSKNPISDPLAVITADIKYRQQSWRVHLQMMILQKDPVKYLAKFL